MIDFEASSIEEIQIDFESQDLMTFETRNCSAGANPVMHILLPGENGQRTQLAVDDDGAGDVNARIALQPPAGVGIGFLLLRAQRDAVGQCDIWRNGLPWRSGLDVGGKTVVLSRAGVNDVVQTVTRPGGWDVQKIYVLDGVNITGEARSRDGLGAKFTVSLPNVAFLVHGGGPTRVVVNDSHTDADGDGLGDALEVALGTCSTPTEVAQGFDCALARTPMDTDGDGLSDAWETLGKEGSLTLPKWGADPRHKDMFVELDFREDSGFPMRLSSTEARKIQSMWGDTVQPLTPALGAAHAARLRNPDGLPGVSVHLDGCVPAAGDAMVPETLCGNWGGYNVVPADTNYHQDWQTWMAPERRGVFHWVMGVRSGGGQAGRFAVVSSLASGPTIAHELGHTMGLNHWGQSLSGVLNCKPQYASTMNYAYAFPDVGFAGDMAPASMNNQSLLEFGNLAAAPNPGYYADLYERSFGYYVDRNTWSVDFNRDGEIAPGHVRVRAFANNKPGGSCEGVRERRTVLMDGTPTTRSPAITRVGNKVAALAATDSGLEISLSSDTYFNCSGAGGGNGDSPCGTFGSPYVLISAPVTAVDAVQLPATQVTLFTFVDATGALYTGTVQSQSSGTPYAIVSGTPLFKGVVGEPSLALETESSARLIVRAAGGLLKQARFENGFGWFNAGDALNASGTPFHVLDAPAIISGRMPNDTAHSMYMHATHDAGGFQSSSLLKLNAEGRWASTSFSTGRSISRPALAYVPDATNAAGGKLYALYTAFDTGALRMRTSGVLVSNDGLTKTPVFGFDSFFDNVWATGHGVDLMFDPGKDTNLRAAVIYDFGDWNQRLVFQPLADGIVDLTYGSSNDWEQIGWMTCASVANPGDTVSNPIPCFAGPPAPPPPPPPPCGISGMCCEFEDDGSCSLCAPANGQCP